MKDPAQRQRLINHVFDEKAPVYALIDGALGMHVYDAVRFSDRPFESLYEGRLSPEIREASPYLVDMSAGHPFTTKLLSEGWGRSWGFFITVPNKQYGMSGLRVHLRQFLRAETEDGRRLLFRFYDPRILRAYLPTCRPEEIATFFGPIGRFIVEDDDAATAVTFSRGPQGTLAVSHLDLAGP